MRKIVIRIWQKLISWHLTDSLSDEVFLKLSYWIYLGKKLNLQNPKSYNEKLQWLKLFDHNPIYSNMVDKYEVRKYVEGKIGAEYLIPSFGVWDKYDDIDIDSLPNQFVLKCTHDSGGIFICKDKVTFNSLLAKKILSKSLMHNFYLSGREWAYKNTRPRIVAEKYMEDASTHELRDYKFFVFNGSVKALFIATNRFGKGDMCFDFFDENSNHLDLRHGHPNANPPPTMPIQFAKMKELAIAIAGGFPHVRVDFYEANDHIYFGELTFYHHSGFVPFCPESWDFTFGDWIDLGPLLNR